MNTVYTEAGIELPRLTYLLVKENSSTRFFQSESSDVYSNPNVGTFVDNTVTLPGK